jgi:hypothetical protein
MAQEHIRISSDWGNVTAELSDNSAARSLLSMLPLTIEMSDHLRQEKTVQACENISWPSISKLSLSCTSVPSMVFLGSAFR